MYFVATIDGAVVGGAGIAPLAGADPLTCELQRMYLRKESRGQGVGEALLAQCLAAAKQFLFVRCYLETITPMKSALSFYGRNGFRELPAPMGRTGHHHNDRWMVRPVRPGA
jgi:putative acetyltransferase